MLSPKTHVLVDCCTVAAFALGAAHFWNRNRRASVAALVCGGTQVAINLMTDYSGEGNQPVSLRMHREIDLGLAAMSAVMPKWFAFEDKSAKTFFVAQGAVITAASQLTRLPATPGSRDRRRRHAQVA